MKIAIIVLSCGGRYEGLVQGIKKTWGSLVHPDIDIYYNYANPHQKTTTLIGNHIVSSCEEGRYKIHKKSLLCYEWLVNNKKYDYVFRCCCGCYVIQENLYKFLENKPKNNFYCGVFGKYEEDNGIFCSGSGYFLSWDLVEDIVKNQDKVLDVFQDDVNLGRYLTVIKGIKPEFGQRWDYSDKNTVKNLECLHTCNWTDTTGGVHCPTEQLGYNYHYHLAHSFDGSSFNSIHQCYLNNKFC